jgi:hypothetical protein
MSFAVCGRQEKSIVRKERYAFCCPAEALSCNLLNQIKYFPNITIQHVLNFMYLIYLLEVCWRLNHRRCFLEWPEDYAKERMHGGTTKYLYIEHHSVCPLVRTGTPPTPLPERVGGTIACG